VRSSDGSRASPFRYLCGCLPFALPIVGKADLRSWCTNEDCSGAGHKVLARYGRKELTFPKAHPSLSSRHQAAELARQCKSVLH
jgi:hypothetical protein